MICMEYLVDLLVLDLRFRNRRKKIVEVFTPGTVDRQLRPNNLDTTGSSSGKTAEKPNTLYQE
jgi:hypothetical protein